MLTRYRTMYGMKHRGFSPGCQPKDGLVRREDDATGQYFDVLIYNRELSESEIKNYELEFIGEIMENN